MGLFSNGTNFNSNGRRTIARVKVLGIRTAENTKILATYNTTLYSLLVEYTDNSRSLEEVYSSDMGKFLPYIQM